MTEKAWSIDTPSILKSLGVNQKDGLSSVEAKNRYKRYGGNELAEDESRTFLEMILEQFDDPLVKILLAAALISTLLAFNEALEAAGFSYELDFEKFSGVFLAVLATASLDQYVEPLVILLILFLNAAVGVWQESNAEKSLEELKKMQPAIATVLRDGKWHHELPAVQLVPGDIVKVTVGQVVPADCRIVALTTTTLRTEEMALTGESTTVFKDTSVVSREAEIQARSNMLFSGTNVANGTGIAVVVATGLSTELGKIHVQIKEAESMKAEEKTPLKQKLSDFSDQLQYIIGFVCLLVWIINYHYFIDFKTFTFDFKACIYYFQIAVALAVAAIPEGLPAVITMCLALGTRKMAKKNSIVRRLPAVETLGCTTVICSDKTGTLTTNQMSVKEVVIFDKQLGEVKEANFKLSGTSFDPTQGEFDNGSKSFTDEKALQQLAKIATLCNDAEIICKTDYKGFHKYEHVGMPTEAALHVMVEKMLRNTIDKQASPSNPTPGGDTIRKDHKRHAVLEFTRDRKSMSVLSSSSMENQNDLLVKGAPENLLARSEFILFRDGSVEKLTNDGRAAILSCVHRMAGEAWRCLGFAFSNDLAKFNLKTFKESDQNPYLADPSKFVEVESGLIFVGVAGLRDPPREEVKDAIAECSEAGISVVVITGDNKITAEAICRDIGVFSRDENLDNVSFLGKEFSKFSDAEKLNKLYARNGRVRNFVVSRCEPKFKQDIVKLLKDQDEVVAMTGDGVNDAPALKLADIGVAMGITGTEVAKSASDMVLADDNFSTIVSAIEEGRSIYNNMKAFIRYMISSNVGEVASIFFTATLGIPEGLIPVQLLWVNLVTDGPPATALGFNPADPGIMKELPRNKNEVLISNWLLFRYIVVGLYVGIATVGIFIVWYTQSTFLGLDISADNHPLVSLNQLMSFENCDESAMAHATGYKVFGMTSESEIEFKGCEYFDSVGKQKASTLSLSVLVTIEMFNALNALSENESLLVVSPFVNPYLLLAMLSSFVLHFTILYIPAFGAVFEVVPLSVNEWLLVLLFSFPVIVIDEILKFFGRRILEQEKDRLKKIQ